MAFCCIITAPALDYNMRSDNNFLKTLLRSFASPSILSDSSRRPSLGLFQFGFVENREWVEFQSGIHAM